MILYCFLNNGLLPQETLRSTGNGYSELLVSGCTLVYVAPCLFDLFKNTFSKGLSLSSVFLLQIVLVDIPCVLEKKVEFVVAECHVLYISRGLVM